MRELTCKHCGNKVQARDETCSSCGIPLPPNHGKEPQKRFILFFIGVCLFCVLMMIWLPPNWSALVGK